jgi:hypothetical protein
MKASIEERSAHALEETALIDFLPRPSRVEARAPAG